MMSDLEVRTQRGTVCDSMYICTASSRTTYDRFVGRKHFPLSVFSTSFQLCPSVNFRVHCKADRSYFTREDNRMYIDFQERSFCVWTVSKYFTWSRTIPSYSKSPKIVSDANVMATTSAVPQLHFSGPNIDCSNSCYSRKVIPSGFSPLLTVLPSWMWLPRVTLLHCLMDRYLPSAFSNSVNSFPYAQFLMACFQQTFKRCALCTHECVSKACCHLSSMSDSGSGCNSSRMSRVCSSTISCHSSACCHCETESNCVNSCILSDSGASNEPKDISLDMTSSCENSRPHVSSSDNSLLSRCVATTQKRSSAEVDGVVNDAMNSSLSTTNRVTCTAADDMSAENHVKLSFFVRVSSETSSDDDADDEWSVSSDDDDDGMSEWWDDDDDDNLTNGSRCFLADLDPFKVNGLYIPPESNTPISSPQYCHLPLLNSTTEFEMTESEKALKLINDNWQRLYSNDDVNVKSSSRHDHTKHVCFFCICIFLSS